MVGWKSETTQTAEDLMELLEAEGIHGVLAVLNSRTEHRFTGVYRLDHPALRNLHLFDRQNPSLRIGADAPLRETYCSITALHASPFSTADAGNDERLLDHPARDSTLSYCGVPLLDESGEAFGTLCHFDLVPRSVPETEIDLMRRAAVGIFENVKRAGS